ncbi:MAG: M14 family metallopeptidase [Candidatus Hinthialibacter antarcticus]|nr:M14 family metallopeptidase [Candidatus Hinthialibacter antarcticus]
MKISPRYNPFVTCVVSLAAAMFIASVFANEAMPAFSPYRDLTQEVKSLSQHHSKLVHLHSLAKSNQGRDVWVLELGGGDKDERLLRPAMLVVGDVEGDRLAGGEAALAFAESLVADENQSRLGEVVVYIIPRLNPDASERYFAKPLLQRNSNFTPYDDDRDGFTDEDAPQDINGDGLVSWMRIEDADGALMLHPNDDRVLIEADPVKGEDGQWVYMREGRDDDGDKELNEDGVGGVNFNKQFTFEYPWFDAQAGMYPLKEKITYALGRFIIDHPHIGVVFTFASNDNLSKTPPSDDATSRRVPQTKITEDDAKYYEHLGEQYRDIVGIKEIVESTSVPGSLVDWVYFHRGRMGLSAAGWGPAIALALKEENEEEGASKEEAASEDIEAASEETDGEEVEEEKRGKEEVEYLSWLGERAEAYFTPWQPVDHPDFPGKTVEVGGWAPYSFTTPPAVVFDNWKQTQVEFLMKLSQTLPQVAIEDVDVKTLRRGVYEITVRVTNTGYLPTVLHHGERTTDVLPTRLMIDLPDEAFLAGKPRTNFGPIAKGEVREARFVLQAAPGSKTMISLISALGGTVQQTMTWEGE